MRKVGIIALALLLAAASGVQARGARFKGSGGSHGSSHSTPHAESSGGGVHLPSVRPRSQDSSEQNQAAAGGATNTAAPDSRAAMQDRLNAELAAQRAATPPGAPVGTLSAAPKLMEPAPLAANERRVTQRTAVEKTVAVKAMGPADLTALVPKDSAKKANVDDQRRPDRFNSRGVNCSLYPARCG